MPFLVIFKTKDAIHTFLSLFISMSTSALTETNASLFVQIISSRDGLSLSSVPPSLSPWHTLLLL